MTIEVEFFEAAGSIDVPARTAARAICDATEPEIRHLLPALAEKIHLRIETGYRVIPQIGCGGRTTAPRCIAFVVDPTRAEGVECILRQHLRHTLFHECHHLVRGWVMQGGMLPSFIQGVISEGLATAFERDAAGSAPPWGDYPDDVKQWVHELLALPRWASYRNWMFRHPDGRLWIGYRAGTYIADCATRKSGQSAAGLVNTSCEKILELAGLPPPRAMVFSRVFRRLLR